MIVQTDSKWMTYALIGAVLLGALIYDKMNSVATTITKPIVNVAPLQVTPEPASMPILPTSKTKFPSVPTTLPATLIPVAPTQMPQDIIYVVRPGDTLYSIARRHGTSVDAVMVKNSLTSYTIHSGQQLAIPR